MKRGRDVDDKKTKKVKVVVVGEEAPEAQVVVGFASLDENLLYEVLKHVDSRTLGMAACVCKMWHRTAQDERLWELICTRQWANIGCGNRQLRSVVLALGGFRRLHSLYLYPLSKSSSSSSSSKPLAPGMIVGKAKSHAVAPPPPPPPRLSKDEIHLSLSLFSIRYYEKMNVGGPSDRGR